MNTPTPEQTQIAKKYADKAFADINTAKQSLEDLIAQALTESRPVAKWTGKMPSGQELWEKFSTYSHRLETKMSKDHEEYRDWLFTIFQSQQVVRERMLCEEQRKACGHEYWERRAFADHQIHTAILDAPLPTSVRETEKPVWGCEHIFWAGNGIWRYYEFNRTVSDVSKCCDQCGAPRPKECGKVGKA